MSADVLKGLKIVEELKSGVVDQQSLLEVLKQKMERYSIFDLVRVQGFIASEIKYLPSPYREEFRSKWNEQLFCTFKDVRGRRLSCNEPLDLGDYYDFLQRFECVVKNSGGKTEVDSRVLYNLCAAYNLFITRTPPHPVGTPFPGGFRVEKRGDAYFCPVKDKQKDVFEAICKFCVAEQSDMEKD